MAIATLHDLFLNQLQDLYSVETQIIDALPNMISVASDPKLREALVDHLEVTREQLVRLEDAAAEFDVNLDDHPCSGIKGILAEGSKVLKDIANPLTKDAAIIISAQRVEHYEIAVYGGAAQFAKELDYLEAASLLNQTLKEEVDADKKLSGLAEGGLFSEGINEAAVKN